MQSMPIIIRFLSRRSRSRPSIGFSGGWGTFLKLYTCNNHNPELFFYDTNQPVKACREVQDSIRQARCIM
jgi:hypothetical protein